MLKYQFIAKTREKQGLTQEKLAELTGIRKEQISKLENGKIMNPTLITLEKLATALQISVCKLIDESQVTA
jgi:transcriptional regulator with XRE-family HTH domain